MHANKPETVSQTLTDQYPLHVLREYAFLADGRRGAVIGPRGEVSWLCAPSWDSPAVISHLIGGPGIYAITPTTPFVWGGSYEPGSLIWHNRWVTQDRTIVTCRDALAYPGDPHRVVLLRQLSTDKRAGIGVDLQLRGEFGLTSTTGLARDDRGHWVARIGGLFLRWTGAPDGRWTDDHFHGETTIDSAARINLMLEISGRPLEEPPDPNQLWHITEERWQDDQPDLSATAAPRDAEHSYKLLRGMTNPTTGGMVAAATLGLPERAERGRNYDYRYVWIRDQTYAGLAGAVDRPLQLLDDALRFTTARLLEHGDQLAPAYRADGTAVPDERPADNLPGYPGGRANIGNHANNQFQLDAFGELLHCSRPAPGWTILTMITTKQ